MKICFILSLLEKYKIHIKSGTMAVLHYSQIIKFFSINPELLYTEHSNSWWIKTEWKTGPTIYLSIYLSIYLPIYLSIFLPTYLPTYLCILSFCIFWKEREGESTKIRILWAWLSLVYCCSVHSTLHWGSKSRMTSIFLPPISRFWCLHKMPHHSKLWLFSLLRTKQVVSL